MRKHILVPTDFSSNAFNAVVYAFDLFKNMECTFHIYHAYYIVASSKGNPMFPVPDEMEYRSARQSISSEMMALKKKILAFSKNEKHQFHFDFEYGFLTDLIKEKVEKEKIDLVILGTRGVTNDRDIAYGRNAIDVMEKVRNSPVMAVPSNVEFREPAEIVFPTDFEAKYNLKDIEAFKSIAQIANAPIRILHMGEENNLNKKQKENKQLLENQFESVEYTFHWLQNVAVMDGLLHFVKERRSTMICFVNRKHWFFGNIFSNPLVKNLGVHSTVPLLALHDH